MAVAITGIGMICSLGRNRREVWRRLLAGESRMGPVTAFDPRPFGLERLVVAEIAPGDLEARLAEVRERCGDGQRSGRFRGLALVAAAEAIADAGLDGSDPGERATVGVVLGSMSAGAAEAERIALATHAGRKPRVFDNMGRRTSVAVQDIARAFGLCGPAFGVDAACASGAFAFAQGFRLVATGAVPWCVVGGVEAGLVASILKPMQALGVTASSFFEEPHRASRPFDRRRDGFVPAEGACCLVLEEEQVARDRGRRMYARVAGIAERTYGAHPTQLDAQFVEGLMRQALDRADLVPHQIGWINAHATSTRHGDAAEARAIDRLLGGERVPCVAPKSVTGHLLAASGAFEIAFSALSLSEQRIPPTINLDEPDPECPVECAAEAAAASFDAVLCNSFGFGGGSCSVVLGSAPRATAL